MKDIRNVIILALILLVAFLAFLLHRQNISGGPQFHSGPQVASSSPAGCAGGGLDQQISEKRNYKTIYESYHVKNTLNRNTPKIQSCYLEYLKSSPEKTKGQIFADWQIDASGNAFKSNVIFTDFKGEEIVKCIRETIDAMEFPPPPSGRIAYASYTWHFQPEE